MSYAPPHRRTLPPMEQSSSPLTEAEKLAAWRREVEAARANTTKPLAPIGKTVGVALAPMVSAGDFGIDGSEGSTTALDLVHFDAQLRLFRAGKGAPPAPLGNGNYHQFENPNAPASLYRKWWASTGGALADKWYREHHTHVTVRPKAAVKKTVSPEPEPLVTAETSKHRERLEVPETSGW